MKRLANFVVHFFAAIVWFASAASAPLDLLWLTLCVAFYGLHVKCMIDSFSPQPGKLNPDELAELLEDLDDALQDEILHGELSSSLTTNR